MFKAFSALFQPARSALTRLPLEDRDEALTEVGTLALRSGALAVDSGGSNPTLVSLEPGNWAVFQGGLPGMANGPTWLALIRPQLASAGPLVEEMIAAVFVDNGSVFLADGDVLERNEVRALIESEDRTEPKRWPKGFFLSSTGCGDGSFPITTLSTKEHGYDRVGMMAVVVSFSATPSERVLRKVASRLPSWKAKRRVAAEPPRNVLARDPLGRWELMLAEPSEFLEALRARNPWSLGGLQVSHGSETSVSQVRLQLNLTLSSELAGRVRREVESASAGATLRWEELADFSIRLCPPART